MRFLTGRFGLALVAGALFAHPAQAQPLPAKIDYNRDVRPILSNNCFQCHGPDEKTRKARLRLDTKDGAHETSIVVGKPDSSELIARLLATPDDASVMPPAKTGKKLTDREIGVLKQWIKEGANYAPHWAYMTPVRPEVPKTKFPTANPVDAFLFARLEVEKLEPAGRADKYALARRAALDLTGLPPTPDELDVFLKDDTVGAYERLVEKLLAKPAFGEHWARMWLDLARYADSAGYADDPLRTIWKYRDYVIQSFNANKPLDQFTVEQLAGDLLPNPTPEQLIATAFHRNTMTNSEGGTNDEEFRNVAVVDRVNTTYMVWMGTSMGCAQCHTHKYDPFSQTEYFRSFAFFNNTADADRADESPVLPFWADGVLAKRTAVEKQVAELEVALKGKKPEELKAQRDALAALKKELATLRPESTVPVLKELSGNQRRKTRLQFRGNFLDLGDEVTEGTPAALHPYPKGAPKDRLGFANWLIGAENPLTARVMANRFWEQIFGTGIVRTTEEFGAQGELPSHPELLDWLATELVAQRWDLKKFLKLLVTSAAYQQSSKVTAALYERDPDNRLLARGPRVRLTAEMVRDQALFAAGLLSPKMLGPSVRPQQPNLGVSAAFGGSIDWQTSAGEDKYRRGVYTQWRRSNPYPSLSTFDAPNRDTCVVRRARTNTPLQALVTMNDPVYVEAAQALARRAIEQGGKTDAERVAFAFRACLVRPPSDAEAARLVKLYDEAKLKFSKQPAKAVQFATNPLGPLPKGADPSEAAAWTVVANVIMNLDEMLLKR
ncbi:PSD1 and planctomycete cytochrome C domain-containing protein [Gemmata sp. JC717]|uniref:PSD1 and planctomycete cytochrome C domain-containing protein n=1 Tax=Gemmata algarum TaxID=2975278 RepID=UPI0021BA8997|nr:PSD1 and planctomycete cytochrome C domain-containing protein [Gemmata algarum]MDY3552831.1 PSD1 and planctomycete cytochrome C domain-containing protein [Gemmata algarum]